MHHRSALVLPSLGSHHHVGSSLLLLSPPGIFLHFSYHAASAATAADTDQYDNHDNDNNYDDQGGLGVALSLVPELQSLQGHRHLLGGTEREGVLLKRDVLLLSWHVLHHLLPIDLYRHAACEKHREE